MENCRPSRVIVFPFGHVDLDGVAVVHDLPVGGLPLDLEPAAARRDRARQIDRGLLHAGVADRERRVQPAPHVGTGRALVAPVNFPAPRLLFRAHLLLRIRLARCIRLAGVLGAREADYREAGGECLRE